MAQVVYQRGGPPLPFGTIDADEVGTFPLYEGVDPADLGAHEGKALLIVAAPFNPATVVTTPGPIPFGAVEGVVAHNFDNTGARTSTYPAATHGRTTSPTDTPAGIYVPGKFSGDVQTQLSLFSGANPMSQAGATVGELILLDPDGELDTLLDCGWDGADVEIRRGEETADFSTFETVAKYCGAGMVGDLRTKSLRLRPLSWRLDAAELHGNRYLGTGGVEGDAALAGRLKPYAAGYVFNVTPVPINATSLILQMSYTSIGGVTAVRDGGVALALNGNYSTYAALAAATVAPGQYATCTAFGLVRLGAAPVYGVTCDLQGDADVIASVAGPTTRAGVVRRIATGLGSLRFSDIDQIDYRSFQDFENRQPAPVGWYWDGSQEVTKADAITEVLSGCLGWWLVRPNGQLTIGQAEDPETYYATLTLDYAGEARMGEPAIADTIPPRRATFIGWRRNYTEQRQDQLATSVTQADALIYGQPARYAAYIDLWLGNNYPSSPVVYLLGNYRDEADATAEAQRQTRLHSVTRRRYIVPIVMDPLADAVGQRTQVANLNRLGWGAAKQFLACGIEAAGSDVKLHLWG
ncbi:hypothetical protein UFOVP1644_32 [uncultured Caudovirales phage]|uniref:Uncharacterized protein n=3 Tax=uncultured Caudovirales phage TaxID=2100421 RepID=A0A6J5T3T4_9CAUD|nr:hypothetical protein UFOVP1293_14 [uncultured Caudovirales phage]CAB4222422.1 hypothetical protein UFOVP1644_32 [uncultured Caudovirales phage]